MKREMLNQRRQMWILSDRAKSLLAVVAALMAIATVAWWIQRPPQTILDQSTLIITREEGPVLERLYSGYFRAKYHYSGSYSWMNGGEALLVREGANGEWEALRFSHDAKKPVLVTGLANLINGKTNSSRPFYWSVSPDGLWIFIARTNHSRVQYEVATIEGQESRQWQGIYRNQIPIWSSDSKALVEWNSRNGKWIARIYRLDPGIVIDQPLDSLAGEPRINEGFSSNGFVSQVETGFEKHAEMLRIAMSGTNLVAFTVSTPPPNVGNVEFFSFTPAPDGRRIAWLLYVRNLIPHLSLQRQFPFFQTHPRHSLSLWVSRSDGSEPRLLGHFRAGDTVHQVRWTPDNTQISFVHEDQLWAIKAD